MKKLNYYLLVLLVSLSAFANTPSTVEKNPTTTKNKAEMPVEVKNMFTRLDEIKAMDKSDMNRSEKKELRKEVRAINKSLAATNNGVYISVGALLVIIILILIL